MNPVFFATPDELRAWFEHHSANATELLVGYYKKGADRSGRSAAHWVISAKRPETRERRLAQLIADSAAGRPVPPLTRR